MVLVKFRLMTNLCQSLLLCYFNLWTVCIQLYIVSYINLRMWFLQICNCTYSATSMGDERHSNNGTWHIAYHFWPWPDWNLPRLVWASQHVSPLLWSHARWPLAKHPHDKVIYPSAFRSFSKLNGASLLRHKNIFKKYLKKISYIYMYLPGVCTNTLWTLFSLFFWVSFDELCANGTFSNMASIKKLTLKGTSWGHYTDNGK